jgi:16S rRNA (uracil1498-N3)-methyltransferase
MPRFHVQSDLSQNDAVVLDPRESRHAMRVLRLKKGETVELFDSYGQSRRGIVTGASRGLLSITLDKSAAQRSDLMEKAAVHITLAPCVIKPEPMELLIQKASELGVDSLQPVLSARTVVRLSKERWASKIERWRKIAIESCKQCGRSVIPKIETVTPFGGLVSTFSRFDLVLIPTLAISGESVYNVLKRKPVGGRLLILIGPEGDFSAQEAKLAVEHGALPVRLGPWVLRSETAAMTMLAVVHFYYREVCPIKA